MPNPYTLLSEIPKQANYDFKIIERIFGHYRLLPHLDCGLWGTCLAIITETQQAQTHKLVKSPEIQKDFKALQTALLQVPDLILPTGLEFSLLVI